MERPTIKTIANEAGVSIATVSKALNDMPDVSVAVKARIREIAARQGYVLNTNARQLARGHTNAVGVILPDITHRGSAVAYKALAQRLDSAGYAVYLCNSGGETRREAAMAMELLQKQVEVLVVLAATTDTRPIEHTVKGQVPVVYMGGAVNPSAENTVSCDDYKGGMQAAHLLFRRGCRKAAVLTWGEGATAQHERSRGFIAYMQEHGARAKVFHQRQGPSEETGKKLAVALLEDSEKIQGVFATDDLLALGALAVFMKAGRRVPLDIQLIGYGDSPAAGLEMVGLTSVAPPEAEMGICAAELALGLLREGGPEARKISLEPRLIRRKTTLPKLRTEG